MPGISVWSLVLGIPVKTETNADGYYSIPWRFVGGTIMGTLAKNSRVNIKPLNTDGNWWATIPVQFIVGSLHIHGWVGSCAMRSDVNFVFTEHRQNRYWAQLMHAVSLHDRYTAEDRIQSAPWMLTMYAHWDEAYGDASAPMLGHISPSAFLLESIINNIFGGSVSLPTNYPYLFNLLSGLAPDITIKVGNREQEHYSSRLMQTVFHELGHGSHFQKAGHHYWVDYIKATLRNYDGQCTGGYGCGNNPDDGNVGIGESWAEFIGTNHALRNHPNGVKLSRWAGNNFIRFDMALERETFYFNDWIGTGIYNDLIDIDNTWVFEDNWDRIGGLSIKQLYDAFGPNVDEFCLYFEQIVNRYGLDPQQVNEIFARNNAGCL